MSDLWDEINNLSTQAHKSMSKNRPNDTIKQLKRILELLEKNHLTNTVHFRNGLHNLGLALTNCNMYIESIESFEKELELREIHDGPHHKDSLQALDNVAHGYAMIGNYKQVEKIFDKLIKRSKGNLEWKTNVKHNYGAFCHTIGNYPKALQMFESFEHRISYYTIFQILEHLSSLDYLASTYIKLRMFKEAEATLNHAFDVIGKTFSMAEKSLFVEKDRIIFNANKNSFYFAISQLRSSYGSLYFSQQKFDRAIIEYSTSMDFLKKSIPKNHLQFFYVLLSLGRAYLGNCEFKKADMIFQKIQKNYQKVLEKDHPDNADLLCNIALTKFFQNNKNNKYASKTLEICETANSIFDKTIIDIFSFSSENQRLMYSNKIQFAADLFFSAIVHFQFFQHPWIGKFFDLIQKRKTLTLDAMLIQNKEFLKIKYPHLDKNLNDFYDLGMNIANKIIQGPGDNEDPNQYKQTIDELNTKKQSIEKEFFAQIPDLDIGKSYVERKRIWKLLPSNSALIEIIKPNIIDFDNPPATAKKSNYYAVILHSTNSDDIDLVKLAEIESDSSESIDRLVLRVLGKVNNNNKNTNQFIHDSDVTDLKRKILQPILNKLHQNETRLFIAPDGELNAFPFEIFPLENNTFVIDKFEISYLGVGRDLLKFTSDEIVSGKPLIVYNPEYNLKNPVNNEDSDKNNNDLSRGLKPYSLYLSHLPGTIDEAHAITNLIEMDTLSKEKALKGEIRKLNDPYILHFATHGYILEDFNNQFKNKLSPDEKFNIFSNSPEWFSSDFENTLIRSFLCLAGAQSFLDGLPLPKNAENGLLTADDIKSMQLSKTQLVVLSACKTGLGNIISGEGVFGLRRSFTVAGAQTIIMTLWNIDDNSPVMLMENFYRNLLEGKTRVNSLRQAQLALKNSEDYSHPYYWGSFVCLGNPNALKTINRFKKFN